MFDKIPTFYTDYMVSYGTVALIILMILIIRYYKRSHFAVRKLLIGNSDANETTNDRATQNIFIPEESIWKESWIMLKLSSQIGLSMIFELCVENVSLAFFGHLPNSSQILPATGIAISFVNIIAVCPSLGLCQCLWSLIPQAIGSNQSHKLIGLYVQRAFIISLLVQIPLSFLIFLCTKNILYFVGVNRSNDIDWHIIAHYSIALIPYPYLIFTLSIIHRVLQNLNYNSQILITQTITFFLSIGLNYLFIITFDFGYIGGAIVFNFTLLLNIIILVLFLMRRGHSIIFKPLPLQEICDKKGIYQYLSLGIPSYIQVVLRWTIRESIVMLTGYLSDTSISESCTVVMLSLNRLKLIHHGISNASGIRIGKYVGAQSVLYAKRSIYIAVFYETIVMATTCCIYLLFRYQISTLFTDNITVQNLIGNKLIYLCLFWQFNAAANIQVSSIYRSLGYQQISANISLIAQYFVVFPLQLYLLFSKKYNYSMDTENGLYVIWFGSSCGYLFSHITCIFLLVVHINWNKSMQENETRIKLNTEKVWLNQLKK
eukprot:514055_1